MNTHFNSALKQSTSLRKELSALAAAIHGAEGDAHASSVPAMVSPAQFGSLSASLTAFARTIDEYNALARQELNPAKQEKAHDRIRNFRAELGEFRAQTDALKTARDDAVHQQSRAELLGRRAYAAGSPSTDNPYGQLGSQQQYQQQTTQMATQTASSGAGHRRTASLAAGYASEAAREEHAFREQTFFASTNTALDEYLARGQAVLGDLADQREMLKSTQRKMYTVANTLGISGDTIRMIERRAREDKWIFWGCVAVFVLFCWLVLHYLR